MKITAIKILGVVSFVVLSIVIVYILSSGWMEIDETICEEIDNKEEQGSCFFDFARMQDNKELCRKIKDYSVRGDCYYYFAVKNNNIDLCDKAREKKEVCYEDILKVSASEDLCKEINYYYRNDCYYYLAIKTNDSDWCSKTGKREEDCCKKILNTPCKPDLIIEEVSYTPLNPRPFDTIEFNIKIKNIGTKKAGRFEVIVAEVGIGGGNDRTIYSLDKNETKSLTIKVYPIATIVSTKYFRIKVDYKNEINEVNELNNLISKTIYISE